MCLLSPKYFRAPAWLHPKHRQTIHLHQHQQQTITQHQPNSNECDGSADRAQTLMLPATTAGLNRDFELLSTCGRTSSFGRAPFPGCGRPALPRTRAPLRPRWPSLLSLTFIAVTISVFHQMTLKGRRARGAPPPVPAVSGLPPGRATSRGRGPGRPARAPRPWL